MSDQGTAGFTDHTSVEPVDSELSVGHSSTQNKIAEREQLQREIESFLSGGGHIQHIDPNIMADPPKKPENKYGSHPI